MTTDSTSLLAFVVIAHRCWTIYTHEQDCKKGLELSNENVEWAREYLNSPDSTFYSALGISQTAQATLGDRAASRAALRTRRQTGA
jgi:hypothetical protein